jgi:hypothetical protein
LCIDKICLWGISYQKTKAIFLIPIKKFKNAFFSLKKFAFTEIYRVLFADKSVKQFYRFTGKFSVKAQP